MSGPSAKKDANAKVDCFADAFPTLFLPIDVPICPLLESHGRDENQSVLQCLAAFISSDHLSAAPFAHLKEFSQRFLHLHKNDGGKHMRLSPVALKASLQATLVSAYWGLWIREQNATLLVHRLEADSALVLVWEVQCPNRVVTGTSGSVEQALPRCGMKVSWERLVDSSDLLADLARNPQELALPKRFKAGKEIHESRDVNDPLYVLDFLLCALGGELLLLKDLNLVGSSPGTTVQLMKKKMRDEVRYLSSKSPWRRAPMWSVLKSVLQIVDIREKKSDVIYKTFIQTFLVYALEKMTAKLQACATDDILVCLSSLNEASAKLVRRLEKLRKRDDFNDELDAAGATDRAVRTAMKVVKTCENKRGIRPPVSYGKVSLKEIVCDTVHTMPNSRAVLEKLRRIAETKNGDISSDDPQQEYRLGMRNGFPRLRQWSALNTNEVLMQATLLRDSLEKFGISPQDFMGTLFDVSEGVMTAFEKMRVNGNVPPNQDCLATALIELLHAIFDTCFVNKEGQAAPFEKDVRGRSHAILLAVTVCVLIDQIACADCVLLRKHRLGIGSSLNLDALFLTCVKQKQHLYKVEEYLQGREKADGPPPLEAKISAKSFSVQFAKKNPKMQKALREIEIKCAENQASKRRETDAATKEHDYLMQYVRSHNCSCKWERNGYKSSKVECQACDNERTARNINVCYYDKLLPPDQSQKLAVVFDLMRPPVLACQRDCWFKLASLVCKEKSTTETAWSALWENDGRLHGWRSDSRHSTVNLGSTRRKFSESHYSSGHVTTSKDFIVENDYNTVTMGSNVQPILSIESWTWNLRSYTTVTLQSGPYENLQRFFNSCSHSENEVIALKSEASEQLSLREFESVGTLRAGPGLQLVRLANGVAQRNFSFDREDIVSLFHCVLRQAGPRSEQSWLRMSFEILLQESSYIPDICKLLTEVMSGSRRNWGSQNTLLNVLEITRTLLDYAINLEQDEGLVACAGLMRFCRVIAYEWIHSLMTTSNSCTDDSVMQTFQTRIADVSTMGTLSFFDHDTVLSTAEDVARWIYFRAVFNDNYSPNQLLHVSWRRPNLLRAMAVAEELAPRLTGLDGSTKRAGLDKFLKLYWSSANNGNIEETWASYANDGLQGWYYAEFRLGAADGGNVCVIEVDIYGGSFLVNGSPCSRLPKEISAHSVYRRYFGDAMFLVQPQGSGGYRTTMQVQGFYYEFYPSNFNPTLNLGGAPLILKVKETTNSKASDFRALMLPVSSLEGDVPKLLTANHSHWFLLTSKLRSKLYFRPICYNDSRIQDPFTDDNYVLDCSTLKLQENQNGAELVDINSQSFLQLHRGVFNRLSPASYVHVLVNPINVVNTKCGKLPVTIQLPRLQQIRFDYDGSVIISREFKLQVAAKQSFGTLYGLQNGLLLEDPSDSENKLFICPYGNVSGGLSSIKIDTDAVASPPFFQYEVLPELQCLRGKSQTRLEWLYLALLHAQTGRLQRDPFLDCTGTEQTLNLLRSPRCTGDMLTSLDTADLKKQYLPEIKLLVKIAEISPWRSNYYDTGMEMCDTGSRPALCAHPAIAFLAKMRIDEIIHKTLKQSGLADGVLSGALSHSDNDTIASRTCSLCVRAYFLRREYYPKDACLASEEELAIFGTDEISTSIYDPPASRLGKGLGVARFLGFISQDGGVKVSERASLVDLLCTREKLFGILRKGPQLSGFSGLCFDGIHSAFSRDGTKDSLDFADIWMHLYLFARDIKKHDRANKYTEYCNLLAWVSVKYPDYLDHICQLMVVAKYPSQFSAPPKHARYFLTSESDYVKQHVTEVIESNLEVFVEEQPSVRSTSCYYEASLNEWERRRQEHKRVRNETLLQLSASIAIDFQKGGSVNNHSVCRDKVSSPSQLAERIQDLFVRWRNARELKTFLQGVTRALDKLQRSGVIESRAFPPELPPLCRVKTEALPFTNTSFCLETCIAQPDLVHTSKADEYRKMARTGKFEGAFQFQCKSVVTITELSKGFEGSGNSHIAKHHEYNTLYTKTMRELETSYQLASAHPIASYEQFNNVETVAEIHMQLESYHTDVSRVKTEIWKLLEQALSDPISLKDGVGLWNTLTPSKILAALFQSGPNISINNGTHDTIAFSEVCLAFAVSVKHVQRARRCLRLIQLGSAKFPHLACDLETTGCDNWNPVDYPEFLGFEVDNDINIRAVQAQVANEIINTDHGNRLLQLNMGEGKTAVIMPLVLCAAARGKKIVRATVLPSLFSTNVADWQHKLGGLLGRRLFTFCCRRDLPLGEEQAKLMLATLEIIKKGKHFVVTIPEHRLSLENKALDLCSAKCLQSNPTVGIRLLEMTDQLARYGREFLDESDEILSPKYQLIYTLGAPVDMDGGMLRWKINAAGLQSIQQNADRLCCLFPDAIEVSQLGEEGAEFKWVRLLESDQADAAYKHLCGVVMDDVFCGKVPRTGSLSLKMSPKEKTVWESCVLGAGQDHLVELSLLPEKERLSALLLRGLLSHGVLKVMLQKRYRVDYGKHPTRKGYQMAVPYRAKDVAAERTEFGHPDMALGLTFASYYQSGLEESELRKVFQKLSQMSETVAKTHYSDWVQAVPNKEGIAEYEGVNLQDPVLFNEKLFPSFHRNIGCIDFYLCTLILPVQAKQFAHKLLSTAGDLCRNAKLRPTCQAVTTGFSGTDDLSDVLPSTIRQINLDDLAKTNGMQLRAILQSQNNQYYALQREGEGETSTSQILARLGDQEKRSNVVLDSGALVLHKDNAEFSGAWLALRPEMEACVFFVGDKVFYVTHSSNGRKQTFRGSPYAQDMSKCLLYLDDVHTRGSDFALPLSTRAIVTLGKGMTKDKFVQSCMRMRQLQRSQSLSFIAAPEVDLQLRSHQSGPSLESAFVPRVILDWTISNTIVRICDLLPYFINQAVSTIKKANAFAVHYDGFDGVSTEGAEKLAAACIEDEVLLLQDMYGHPRDTVTLLDIADRQLSTLPAAMDREIVTELRDRIARLAPLVCRQRSLFDEEQERELENELEEERQIERPPPACPSPSEISPELAKLLNGPTIAIVGDADLERLGFSPLYEIFKETSMYNSLARQMQGINVFCTHNFALTVKGSCQKDPYVKHIQWMLLVPVRGAASVKGKTAKVIISNFEAEHFRHLLGETLFSFAALQRRGQHERVLHRISAEGVPACVHVVGGSLYCEGKLLAEVQKFLAIYPCPTDGAVEGWNRLFHQGHILRDGFVPVKSREIVDQRLCQSPFTKSPVGLVVRFLSNMRHASEELPNSPLGRLLGVSEMDQVEK